MARVIPVDGPMGPEEQFFPAFRRLFPNGCLSSHDHLPDGTWLHSRLDVVAVNPVASDLAGKTIYGPALVIRDEERFGK